MGKKIQRQACCEARYERDKQCEFQYPKGLFRLFLTMLGDIFRRCRSESHACIYGKQLHRAVDHSELPEALWPQDTGDDYRRKGGGKPPRQVAKQRPERARCEATNDM